MPDLKPMLNAGTAVIADVFDTLKLLPPVLDTNLFAVNKDSAPFVGPAYTVTGKSEAWSSGGDRAKLQAIDEMPPGTVAVWAGTDAKGVCCFGDLLASAMNARGCAGVVVDGGVRDVAFLQNLGMPVVTRYKTPAQAIGRWKVQAKQIPVQVRGGLQDWVTVNPGDIVVADDDGVIIVPANLLTTVIDKVLEWAVVETNSRAEIQNGLPLLAALEKYGHL
jgi:4-hydroxy-4-methyl-2-oxoglutarate aldolase